MVLKHVSTKASKMLYEEPAVAGAISFEGNIVKKDDKKLSKITGINIYA